MTTLGKILVSVLFLFSIITSAFIIMDFIPSTNWRAGYNNLSNRLVRERESHIAAVNARNELEAKKNQEIQAVDNQLKMAAKELEEAKKVAADDRAKRIKIEAQQAELLAINEKLKALSENREAEVQKIDAILKENAKKSVELAESNKMLSEKMVEFQIKYQSAKERNEGLVLQVQNLLKDNERMRLGEAARTRQLVRNPPPEDIKGRIKAADQQSGLVTVNLGSDSGLNKGNTLEVYRLAPKPTYLGTLRITDVRPTEAVGRLINSNRRGGLQVGDEVASEILSRR